MLPANDLFPHSFCVVDLKYLTPHQIVEISYEGKPRRFELKAAFTSAEDSVSSLENGIAQITLGGSEGKRTQSVWTVGWDSVVTIDLPDDDHSENIVDTLPL